MTNEESKKFNREAIRQRVSLAEKKARLQDGALEAIGRRGLASTSTRDIAEAAQQNLAAIHYAFDNKDELLASLPFRLREQVSQVLVDAAEPATSFSEAIQLATDAYWQHVVAEPHLQKAHYELTLFALSSGQDRAVAAEQYGGYLDVINSLIKKHGREEKSLALTRTCLALMDGIILQFLATDDEIACREALSLGISALISLHGAGTNNPKSYS